MQNYIGQQIDRYRITERLGTGGMAVVYKAYDTRLERDVALKLIRMGSIPVDHHERLRIRFEREAKTQARLSHSNIVPVYADGELKGEPYLVMAYLAGGTLKAKLGHPKDYRTAIQWTQPIADALSYAHQMGVIHRDVKPSNILFNHDQIPLLADFGIAKILDIDDMTLTATGLGVGTPEYMAPEQWLGEAIFASDQYAVAVLLYELLTGQKPYCADTPYGVALMQLSEPLLLPSKIAPDIPPAVESLIIKAMSPDPQNRFEDMHVFHDALNDALAGKTVTVQQIPHIITDKGQSPVDDKEGWHNYGQDGTLDLLDNQTTIDHLSAANGDKAQDKFNNPRKTKKRALWRAVSAVVMLLLAASLFTSMRWGVPINVRSLNRVSAVETTRINSISSTTQPTNIPIVPVPSTSEPTQTVQVELTATFIPTEPVLVAEEVPAKFSASFNYVHNNAIKHYDGESGETSWVMDIEPSANPQPLTSYQRWNETRWSANGRYLLYSPKSSEQDGSWDYYDNGLYVYDTIANTSFTVSEKLSRFWLLPWSPNHEYALFSSDIEGVPGLFIYDVKHQSLNTVSYLNKKIEQVTISWSGDSQYLEFRVTGNPKVRRYDVQSNELSDSPNERITVNANQEYFFDDYGYYREIALEEDDSRVINFYGGSSCLTITQKSNSTETNKLCFNEEVTYLGKSHNQLYHYFYGYDKLYYIDMDSFEVVFFQFEPGFSSPKECLDLN
jgi:serine/threonine protein kinase